VSVWHPRFARLDEFEIVGRRYAISIAEPGHHAVSSPCGHRGIIGRDAGGRGWTENRLFR